MQKNIIAFAHAQGVSIAVPLIFSPYITKLKNALSQNKFKYVHDEINWVIFVKFVFILNNILSYTVRVW